MNDTEKIEGLINELEEIEEEQKDNVPVITKEYNIGDEEPTTEQERTKIMESIQENIEQEPVEEQKEENPVLIPLPDKNKKKKKLIAIILIVAIVILIIAIICLSIFVKPNEKKGKSKENTKDDVISYEEYKTAIKGYGDAVTKAYKELKQKNKNITNVTIEDLEIEYKDYEVTCNDVHFNYDKSVYLNDCLIKGYENKYNYHYGEKESEDSKYKIYLYTINDTLNYAVDMDAIDRIKEDIEINKREDRIELKRTITCKEKEYKVFINYKNNKDYIIYDDGKYTLYNITNDSKNILSNMEKEEVQAIEFIEKNNKLFLLAIRAGSEGKIGYYHVGKEKYITKADYNRDYTTDNMREQGYLALSKDIDSGVLLVVINQVTGDIK